MKFKIKNKSINFVFKLSFSKTFKRKIKKILCAIGKFLWDILIKVVVGVIVKVLVDRLFYFYNRTFLFGEVINEIIRKLQTF
ncbi:MAG: hypothetical protein V8R15_00995 [Bacilli bacterium]